MLQAASESCATVSAACTYKDNNTIPLSVDLVSLQQASASRVQLRAPWSDTGYNTNARLNATIIIPCDFGVFSGSELPLLHYSASVSHTRENGIKVNFSNAPAGAVACTKEPHCYVFLL